MNSFYDDDDDDDDYYEDLEDKYIVVGCIIDLEKYYDEPVDSGLVDHYGKTIYKFTKRNEELSIGFNLKANGRT